ncbi:hypothetical protein Btru_066326 [Bulinus truncatus]|nr:hypothetical protein Btru_066326 [Bulinus truncatus]
MHHHPPNQERAINLSILTVSGPGSSACFEHSNFFKVNAPATRDAQRRAPAGESRQTGRAGDNGHVLIPITGPRKSPVLLFFVTTSPCREWVSCAPAAFLGCGSRFSCSLSGIEP